MRSSWKRQKVHFHNLPHLPDHLAKPWVFTRSLSMKKSSVFLENTTSLCDSLSRLLGEGREGWLALAILLADSLVQLGDFFQKKCSPRHDSESMTILFAGRTPSDFIFSVCWAKGWMGLWKRWLEDTRYWAGHFQAEAQASDAKLAWYRDQSPLVVVIAQAVKWDKKRSFPGAKYLPLIWVVTTVPIQENILSTNLCFSVTNSSSLLFLFPLYLFCHFSQWLEYTVCCLVSHNSHILLVPLCKLECIISKLLSWWGFCPVIPATSSTHSIRLFGQVEIKTFLLDVYRNLQHPVLYRLGRFVKKARISDEIKQNQF